MAVITGTHGNDRWAGALVGTFLDDAIWGLEGDDELHGGFGDDLLYGGADSDKIWGGHDDDMLDGGSGDDCMWGGPGDDSYHIDTIGDVVIEYAGEGHDTVYAKTSYTLPPNVEDLVLLAQVWRGVGNALDNTIHGNDAANQLMGVGGDDTLYGHGGDDELYGHVGDDLLDGGTGDDEMWGLQGNDTYIVDGFGDRVWESVSESHSGKDAGGHDTVIAGISYRLPQFVEDLILAPFLTLNGIGNDLDNMIVGNDHPNALSGEGGNDRLHGHGGNDILMGDAGNDVLDGGTGVDHMSGGSGSDTYWVDYTGDIVVELAGQGADTVMASDSYTLPSHVEDLVLIDDPLLDMELKDLAVEGIGNSLDNVITGNRADNTLVGADGDDVLIGGLGADLQRGGRDKDTFWYNKPQDGGDTIADFVSGADRFAFDDRGFGLSGRGTLASLGIDLVQGSGRGAAPTGFGPTVIFDTQTHELSFDADGRGLGGPVLIATLPSTGSLAEGDFLIV
jgi:Ca2+-binding RTX toxin-like protein